MATFGKLKYVNSQAFEEFRKTWKAKYLGGFVVHSRAFDALKGDFPIGFLIWDTSKPEPITEIVTDVLDRNAMYVRDKTFVNVDNDLLLSTWPARPRTNKTPAIPLKGAVEPATTTADLRGTRWSDGALGWFNCAGNDLQQASRLTMILSSGFASGRGFFINKDNLWQVAVMFTVRRIVKPSWLNDRDQFLQPTEQLSNEFKNDCLVWTLFNGANYAASVDKLRWDGKDWPLVNHFLPFTETEVGVKTAFASNFMTNYMSKLKLSTEAKAVMSEGRKLFHQYHQQKFGRTIVDEYKLGRPDVGWWQVRRALKDNSANQLTNFDPFDEAYETLSEKILPQVYELGFLLD